MDIHFHFSQSRVELWTRKQLRFFRRLAAGEAALTAPHTDAELLQLLDDADVAAGLMAPFLVDAQGQYLDLATANAVLDDFNLGQQRLLLGQFLEGLGELALPKASGSPSSSPSTPPTPAASSPSPSS